MSFSFQCRTSAGEVELAIVIVGVDRGSGHSCLLLLVGFIASKFCPGDRVDIASGECCRCLVGYSGSGVLSEKHTDSRCQDRSESSEDHSSANQVPKSLTCFLLFCWVAAAIFRLGFAADDVSGENISWITHG